MPVVLDPDAAAVYKAFQDAGRPAYETLTAPEARAYYGQARFATNPEPPELARVAALAIPAPHGGSPPASTCQRSRAFRTGCRRRWCSSMAAAG